MVTRLLEETERLEGHAGTRRHPRAVHRHGLDRAAFLPQAGQRFDQRRHGFAGSTVLELLGSCPERSDWPALDLLGHGNFQADNDLEILLERTLHQCEHESRILLGAERLADEEHSTSLYQRFEIGEDHLDRHRLIFAQRPPTTARGSLRRGEPPSRKRYGQRITEDTTAEGAPEDPTPEPDDPGTAAPIPEPPQGSPAHTPEMKAAIAQVLAVNQKFYQAHEARDVDAMISVWEHTSRAVCIHPGWPALVGWPAIKESWQRIFGGPGRNQFILTDIRGTVHGNVAWVTLDENLMDRANTGTIAATNIFVRTPTGWRLTLHQGSPVAIRQHSNPNLAEGSD